MKTLWVFPGQGSQRKGMGADLFERYPRLVEAADALLGYSLHELCLDDPAGVLDRTEYTQPALFAVSALAFLDKRDRGAPLPDFFAGHSLGEFAALFAAGGFDFETGLAMVAKRGELMARAPRGAMAAVIGLGAGRVRELLDGSGLSAVDIANINSGAQIVISGLFEDIERCEPVFAGNGGRFVRLNVSAAFHSRYMREVEAEFAEFVAGRELRPLTATVIANGTARPYPREGYAGLLAGQMTRPVNWYESISWLLAQDEIEQQEIGPGDVLTGLFFRIRKDPMPIAADAAPAAAPARPHTVFMYSGQGSQYYGMGRQLYTENAAFRAALDGCNAVYRDATGRDLVAELYDEAAKWREMNDVTLSGPALFGIGHALTAAFADAGVRPDCVVGYSLGEYAAAVAAGAMSMEDALRAVIRQAKLLAERAQPGAMLNVLASPDHFAMNPEMYQGTTLAAINFDRNFVVSGPAQAVSQTLRQLEAGALAAEQLPVECAFHSPLMDTIRDEFIATLDGVSFAEPAIPLYSATLGTRLTSPGAAHYWAVTREPLDFRATIAEIARQGECRFVDLGPSGALSGFIRHGFGGSFTHLTSINRFGRNLQTVAEAIGRLAA